MIPVGRAALWLPMDDALISGPETRWLRDPRKLLIPDLLHHVDAVLGFAGLAERCQERLEGTSFIMNLTASTTNHDHTRKVLVNTPYRAKQVGATAVAVHVNLSSDTEQEQLAALGQVVEEARDMGLPVVAIVYPRNDKDHDFAGLKATYAPAYVGLVRHCARVAVELGADMVKVPYTGSVESFETVVEVAMGIPVLIAGGMIIKEHVALELARDAVAAGASGVAFGRQVFAREDPFGFVVKLSEILNGPPGTMGP